MAMRREQRLGLALPVRISGMDTNGCLFEQDANTIDVTTAGARIGGVKVALHRGCILTVQRGYSKARFRVMWVSDTKSTDKGEIGVQLLEPGKCIWGRALPRLFGDSFVPHGNRKVEDSKAESM